ncbi:MAG: YtxH domain-containing protein [Bacteroidota bacterium]|nr:YtxH domain-containing protein [Bacteroidota bacterium]
MNSTARFWIALTTGALAGVGAAYLLKSERGSEILQDLRDRVSDVIDGLVSEEDETDYDDMAGI